MDYSTPDFHVLHYLPEFAQTHVHWVSDAIQPFHPLSSPSPAFNLSQHQSLIKWVSSSHQVAKVLELHLQHQSFQWIIRVNFLLFWWVWSPCCPRDSQESSPAPKLESINPSAFSLLYGPTLTSVHDYWKNHGFDFTRSKCWCFENSFLINGGGSFQSPACQKCVCCLGRRGMAPVVGFCGPHVQGNSSCEWPGAVHKCTL